MISALIPSPEISSVGRMPFSFSRSMTWGLWMMGPKVKTPSRCFSAMAKAISIALLTPKQNPAVFTFRTSTANLYKKKLFTPFLNVFENLLQDLVDALAGSIHYNSIFRPSQGSDLPVPIPGVSRQDVIFGLFLRNGHAHLLQLPEPPLRPLAGRGVEEEFLPRPGEDHGGG